MARTKNEEDHAGRRNEILDVTTRLVYTKGYEQMTVQDVLDELKISKGAFYHYFNSKQDLMECMIARLMEEGMRYMQPIVDDEHLPAIEKLQRYFDTAVQWKTARKATMLAVLRVWYADENALVRQKMFAATMKSFAPAINKIIRQGVQEGVFHPAYPDQVSQIFLALMQGFGENIARLFFQPDPGSLKLLMASVRSFEDAIERILGAPSGSLKMIDEATMKIWLEPEGEKHSHR